VLGVLEYRSSFFEKIHLDSPQVLIIEKGMGLSAIAKSLYEQDVIPSERFFISIVKLQNAAHQLQAERCIFYPVETVADDIEKLEKGETHEENITFPEGITRFQIGHIVAQRAEMDSSTFVNWAESDYLTNEFNIEADVDYYYFLSKGDGTHIFSKTGRGHINAKNAQNRFAPTTVMHNYFSELVY
jgi:cell division protein YceG involved in septum cleavage